MMARIITLDNAIKEIVLQKLKKFDKTIKEKIVQQAKKQGHNISTSNVKSVAFDSLDLKKEVTDLKLGKMTFDKEDLNVVIYSMEYDNNSDTTDEVSFGYKKDIKDSWSWELTAGVTFEYSSEVQIPELVKVGRSVKVNFSATYGETHEKAKHWEWSATPRIPPRSKIMMHAILKQVAGTVPISCTLIADGKIWCKAEIDYWGKHTRKFDIPLTQMLNIKERTYTTTGEIRGASGIDTMVDKQQLPLSETERKELAPGLTKRKLEQLSLKSLALKV